MPTNLLYISQARNTGIWTRALRAAMSIVSGCSVCPAASAGRSPEQDLAQIYYCKHMAMFHLTKGPQGACGKSMWQANKVCCEAQYGSCEWLNLDPAWLGPKGPGPFGLWALWPKASRVQIEPHAGPLSGPMQGPG